MRAWKNVPFSSWSLSLFPSGYEGIYSFIRLALFLNSPLNVSPRYAYYLPCFLFYRSSLSWLKEVKNNDPLYWHKTSGIKFVTAFFKARIHRDIKKKRYQFNMNSKVTPYVCHKVRHHISVSMFFHIYRSCIT